jgi:hypothetical protein
MDVTTLLEPKINLDRLAEVLDGLGHDGRCHTTRTWTKDQYAAIFEAAKGFRPIDLDFLVPSGTGVMVEVIHHGHNTLPMFTEFQKRFVKLDDGSDVLWGYNHQSMQLFTGPGYFGVTKGDGEHEGELVIDYGKIPKQKPASWPPISANDSGIAALVSGGMVDYLRALSSHVSIGAAFKNGAHRKQWFAMVRKDPG